MVGDDVKMMEVRHVIQTQISDPARSVALLNRVSYAETQLGEINEEYVKYSKKFGKVTANHSKGASDLHLILREWEAQSSSNRHRITETLLDMKNYTSAEEWPAISTAFMNSITKQSDRYKVLHYTPNS